jgi:hypothetical protein
MNGHAASSARLVKDTGSRPVRVLMTPFHFLYGRAGLTKGTEILTGRLSVVWA